MNAAPLSSDQLQQIRDTDAASGEDLQLCPAAWQHRRDLLGHITALEEVLDDKRRLTVELERLLNGEQSALAPSLCDIVGQVQRWVAEGRIITDERILQMQQQHHAAGEA